MIYFIVGMGLTALALWGGPIGAVIAIGYFLVDLGFMIFSDKSLSDRIDEQFGEIVNLWEPLLPLEDQYQLQLEE